MTQHERAAGTANEQPGAVADTGPPLLLHFIGNATLLVRYGPLTLLTDPNFLHRGQFAHLGYGLVSRRLTEPALSVEEAAAAGLDAIVLSHLHGDHWDRVARHGLDSALPVLTTPHAARRLRHLQGFRNATGLRAWESRTLSAGGVQIKLTAMPARHAGNLPLRLALPPVMGSMLECGVAGAPPSLRLYISGDTMLFDGLRRIADRYPVMDVAVLHLGGTRLPGGFVVTLDGARGAELVDLLRPDHVLPVHYGDYTVMKSPLADFVSAAHRRGTGNRVAPWTHGQQAVITPGARTVDVV
jgi:L-ascorbate metabolism protein UlaG (beta-lactamase superfamily)